MGRVSSLETLERREAVAGDSERRETRRAGTELWREKLDWLGLEERVLLKTYLEAQSSFDELARLRAVNRSSMCRRVHRLLRRLTDETFDRCVGGPFSPWELTILRDHLVCGRPLGRVAREQHVSYYRVRVVVARARAFARVGRCR